MNWWEPLISLASVLVAAVVGGLVVHRLPLRRESLVARRTQRVAFLLDAYRKRIDASERDILGDDMRSNVESALADIMLSGGQAEIDATERFQRNFVEGRGASLVPVIVALRSSVRNELGIEAVDLPDRFNFRLSLDSGQKATGRRDHRGRPKV
ncbi:hypothetical protein H9651_04270 [Microbacterium sp. Sa4CUA7]|uniref:Uncharacterized protein n=1 Tax=Microbacterium pullorum TaxID=2762236 RepID=A0ABR8S021_9MICO|nr:hypothetical protein [Microbacterium pullorum]MBD7956841.1 hypothetical protein [Microbacterium pullorum]